MKLYTNKGGSGDRTFLLLHGLGCNGDVWKGLISKINQAKAGKWIAPDLRGHGRSDWAEEYCVGYHANDLATILNNESNIIVVGHSMGAYIGIILALGIYNLDIKFVLGIGQKTKWLIHEKKKLFEFAEKPVRIFKTKSEALMRYLKVSGLNGIIDVNDPRLDDAIVKNGLGYALAADPKTVLVAGSSIGLFQAASYNNKIRLVCGEYDNVTNLKSLQELDKKAFELRGLSHNAHVEDPTIIWNILENLEQEYLLID